MGSNDGGEHIAAFSVEEGARDPAILYTIPANARLTLSRPSVYLVIDGERLDDLMSGRQEAKSLSALDESVRERVSSLLGAQAFKQMPFERLVRCAEAMEEVEVDVGEEIVKQGDPGDYFYVLKAGSAEVRRAQEGTSPAKVAMLSAGDSFGEEALLKGEPRNATVHMTTPGRVLKLAQGGLRRADRQPAAARDRRRGGSPQSRFRRRGAHRLPLRGGVGAVAAQGREARAARGDPRALARPRPQARVHRLLPHRPAQPRRRIPDAPSRPQGRLAGRAASPPGPTSARPASSWSGRLPMRSFPQARSAPAGIRRRIRIRRVCGWIPALHFARRE